MTNPPPPTSASTPSAEALMQLAKYIADDHMFSDEMDAAAGAFVSTRYGINKNAEQAGEEVSGEKVIRRSLQAAFISYLESRAAELSPQPASVSALPIGWLITWNDPTYRGKQTLSFDKCSPDDGTCEPVFKGPK